MKHITTFLMLIALAFTASAQITLTVLTLDDKQAITTFHTGDRYNTGIGTFSSPDTTFGDTLYVVTNGEPPSIFQLSRIDKTPTQPERKYLFLFKRQKTAQIVSEIAGYAFLGLGAYLGGKAEYYSRYHGTTSNWDTYHVTRDAGLVSTGLGCTLVGFGLGTDDKLEPWEIGIKAFGMLLGYRSIAEATYNSMKK